jgi:hypothetical protein
LEQKAAKEAKSAFNAPNTLLALKIKSRPPCVDAWMLGTKEFVDRIFGMKKDHFPIGRMDGARKLRGAGWGVITALRDLKC